MKRLFPLVFILFLFTGIQAQQTLLQSGPMVCYSTMKEVMLWVQTTERAKVQLVYWQEELPQTQYRTDAVITTKANAYVAKLLAAELEPGNRYEYALYINDQEVRRPYRLKFQSQPIWLWRGDAPDFSFAAGSCAYINQTRYDRPGDPYGGDYQIFTDIYNRNADFMLWLGDNVYLREADWNSRTGIIDRYTHTRSNPEMQAMLGSMHHYAIWDDHDYGPNNSDRSYWLKRETEEAFKLFFPNPNYIFDEGITGFFQWADCEFFLMDNRYWRTPNKRTDLKNPHILGKDQVEWLIDALANSYAPFKFVVIGGQFISPLEIRERHAKCAPEERLEIIDAIRQLKIDGVIFMSGDVHHTELSRLDLEMGYPLYDLTVSPLTSGTGGRGAEANPLQLEGTLVAERNYAHLKVSGSREERTLSIDIYDSNGEKKWSKAIKAADLKFK